MFDLVLNLIAAKIPPMRFTDKKPEPYHSAHPRTTLQIFSLKVADIRGLQWPLHVFGKVAVRDTVDHKRNMIFDRTRENCQILTSEVCVMIYVLSSTALAASYFAT